MEPGKKKPFHADSFKNIIMQAMQVCAAFPVLSYPET